MKRSKKSANPFYALLVLVGVAFVVSAAAFCVMTVRATAAGGVPTTEHPLLAWMDQHGVTLLIVELALLMISTFGAIGTDSYWQRRAARSHDARRNQ